MTSSPSDKPTVGVVGLGLMGSRMARRLLEAGHRLLVHNRTREKAVPLEQAGAVVAQSPAELAAGCDVVLSSLANDQAVEAVYLGAAGVLSGIRPGTTILEASTIFPETSRKLHRAVAEKGAQMLDAPVSGSTPQAEQGQLAFLIGGDEQLVGACEPIWQVLGKSWFHMGGPGAGAMMKLVVNALLGLGLEALAEATVLGQKGGIELERLLDVLGQLAVVSPSQKAKMANVKAQDYPASFPMRLMHKDLGLVTRQAAELGVPMPAAAAAQQAFSAARGSSGEQDASAIVAFFQRLASV